MNQGYLSSYFEGVAIKQLSAVEANPSVSNQHEFNGVGRLKRLLGTGRKHFSARFIYLGEDENDTIVDTGNVTWYDAREAHPTRSEYRLYYPETTVSGVASEGDLLVIGKIPDGSLLIITVRAGTTYENQIMWLFSLQTESPQLGFFVHEIEGEADSELDYTSSLVLSEIGIDVRATDDNYLDLMLDKFGGQFPTTRIFSEFSRGTLDHASAVDDPDGALMAWMNQEEILFRTLERHFLSDRIKDGFEDVDSFISYSLSVQNRRKSRAGLALENHLEKVFLDNAVNYSRGKQTENKSKPDFIFPHIDHYHSSSFPGTNLTMLGVKSTCKDRWRQVLSEASRIHKKHLLTLEPGITEDQTNEMVSRDLQLVIPQNLHETYNQDQQAWLVNVQSFLGLVRTRQSL